MQVKCFAPHSVHSKSSVNSCLLSLMLFLCHLEILSLLEKLGGKVVCFLYGFHNRAK